MQKSGLYYRLMIRPCSTFWKRELPNGVTESRTFDALGRLTTQANSSGYAVVYQHDAVGNLRQMTDTLTGLHTLAPSKVLNWECDHAYRLLSEQVDAVAAADGGRL